MSEAKYISLLYKKKNEGLTPDESRVFVELTKTYGRQSLSENDLDNILSRTEHYPSDELSQDEVNVEFDRLMEVRDKSVRLPRPARDVQLWKWVTGLAASFLLLFGTFSLLNRSETQELVLVKASSDNQELVLSDGSTLSLKKGTTIRYLPFNDEIREIHISGEAYFRITKEKRPFIVRMIQGDVHVLGTSFLLQSGKRERELRVKVLEGRIKFDPKESSASNVVLTAGQRIDLADSHEVIEPSIHSDLNWEWYSSGLKFNNIELDEIINKLSSHYQVNIDLSKTIISSCPVTIQFEHEDILSALNSICIIFKASYTQVTETSYELIGGTCH